MIVSYSDKEKRTGKLFPATSQCVPVMLYITLVTFIIAYSDFFVNLNQTVKKIQKGIFIWEDMQCI